ncbi:FMN-binding protein [Pseudoflavonifractor sp.]|jgi:uncharacterized protein with FMN-binding domain/succinate dehydrogenase/fumarate reductase flavoprotein subunit|uniref:FMN-binding protein n=1 Tax=Pseudoflavonifractor sp. TaxID=1980281 RepID=UPI003D946EDC
MALTVAACTPSEAQPSGSPSGSQPAQGETVTITKTAQGYGGEVTVTVTFTDGVITAVEAVGESETPSLGGVALTELPPKIVEANSADVDGVSGATMTSQAIKNAVAEAIAEANGESVQTAEVKMKPGTYTAQASGFSLLMPLEVSVTVSETAIERIELGENAETAPFVAAAMEKLVPRMLEAQSVRIDSITGATGSSSGIKLAVEAALKEALAAGGAEESAIQNFYSVPEKVSKQETIETDILVVGMGGSGTAAAMSAAEAMYAAGGNDPEKVNVLAIDKAGKYGGTSCVTADTMGINAPVYDETYHGGKDYVDAEVMKADWNNFTKGDAKQDLLDLFFDESGNTIDWLISHGFDYGEGSPDGEGFEYGGPQRGFTDQDVYYCKFQYTGQGYGNWKKETGAMFDSIIEDYTALGGEYMLEVEATELIYDESTNTVTGVKAVGYDGTEYTINAKAVISATGGFSNNAELQEEYLSNEYYPLKGAWLMYGMTQNDGKLFASALDIGAGTYNIGMPPMVHLQGAPITLHEYPVEIVGDENDLGFWSKLPRRNSLNDFPNALASATYGLQVNMEGERFSNEGGTFQTWKSGPRYYTIWSDDFFQSVKENGLPVSFNDDLTCQGGIDAGRPIPEVYDIIDLCIEKGIAYKADTLEELAQMLDVDPAVLTDNVARYNKAVETGVDEDFGKDASLLTTAIADEGPYYAFVGASFIYSTVGGLDVNTDMQVLGSDHETPINGLYAVGTDSLGVLFSEQREYVTYGGAAQGWAYTSGRLAGKAAVSAIQAE